MKRLRNKFEKRINRQLRSLTRKVGASYDYETEKIPYIIASHYIPDFVIKLPDGDKIYIECKGYLRPEDKRKLVAVKKSHPTKDIRILFYRLVRASIKWAERHSFPYAVDVVPREWFGLSSENLRNKEPKND